jgi:hypothetical protein
MGSGVAPQCSRNRCLARWTVWIPIVAADGAAGRGTSKKDLVTGPIWVLEPYTQRPAEVAASPGDPVGSCP